MELNEKLDVPNIAGHALQIIHQMAKGYQKAGHYDPLIYRALKVAGELADQLRDRATEDEAPADVIKEIGDFANSIYFTAMEVGEEVRKVIEENGLPIELMTGSAVEFPNHGDDCGSEDD